MNIAKLKDQHKAVPAFLLLSNSFVTVLLLTNVITAKYVALGKLTLTAGVLTYPFTFLLLDIISEIYGPKEAIKTVWMGLWGSVVMTIVLYVANQLPAHHQSPVHQSTFQLIFGFTPGVVLGSMVAYLTAQFTDIYLFAWVRRMTGNKYLWIRNNVSTLISQWIDTLLFGLIAWIVWPSLIFNETITPLPWSTWYQITINEYVFKVAFTVLGTPLIYGGVYAIKYWERR